MPKIERFPLNILVLFLVAIIAAWLLAAAPGRAEGMGVNFGTAGDTSAPIRMKSDQLSVSQQDGSAVFSGKVLVEQNAMRLSADEVRVLYGTEGKKIKTLKATGNVTLVDGGDAAEAQHADYDVATGVVTLTGKVLVVQGPTSISSDRMTVNLATGQAQMLGNVRTMLQQGN